MIKALLRFVSCVNILVTIILTLICFITNIHTDRMLDTRG